MPHEDLIDDKHSFEFANNFNKSKDVSANNSRIMNSSG